METKYFGLVAVLALFAVSLYYQSTNSITGAFLDNQNTIQLAGEKPDLIISGLMYINSSYVNHTSGIPEHWIELDITAKNIGKSYANPSRARITVSNPINKQIEINIPGLAPNQETGIFGPGNTRVRYQCNNTHSVSVKADSNNVIVESNESNNVKSIWPVACPPQAQRPDLTTYYKIPQVTPLPFVNNVLILKMGQNISIQEITLNKGSTDSAKSVTKVSYQNVEWGTTGSNVRNVVYEFNKPALAPNSNAMNSFNYWCRTPNSADPYTTIWSNADFYDKIIESYEFNNNASLKIRCEFADARRPNLVGAFYRNADDTTAITNLTAKLNTVVTFYHETRNVGNVSTYAGSRTSVTPWWPYNRYYVKPLEPLQKVRTAVNYTCAKLGNFRINAWVDSSNSVVESSENDNQGSVTVICN